jgi:endogenous inhibitor of DNA gyrase (YacG/DUF329 family)
VKRAPTPSAASKRARTCPICGKPQQARYRPFCSRRCADIDLSRWLRGAYAIPGEKQATPARAPNDDEESSS